MRKLEALNATDYFCKRCGIGIEGSCTMPHIERELKTPGSNLRALLWLGMAVLFFAVVGLVWK